MDASRIGHFRSSSRHSKKSRRKQVKLMLIMFYLTQYIQSISIALCDQYFKKSLTDSLHSFFPKLFEI